HMQLLLRAVGRTPGFTMCCREVTVQLRDGSTDGDFSELRYGTDDFVEIGVSTQVTHDQPCHDALPQAPQCAAQADVVADCGGGQFSLHISGSERLHGFRCRYYLRPCRQQTLQIVAVTRGMNDCPVSAD